MFLDQTVVNVALPAIRSSLHGSLADQQWVVEAYLLTLSSLLLLGGSLGDVLGRRRVFTAGLVGFGACSLACALAPSAPVLIGARALQGDRPARCSCPSTLALIVDHFEPDERAAAIGTWTAWTGVADGDRAAGRRRARPGRLLAVDLRDQPDPGGRSRSALLTPPSGRRDGRPRHVDWIGGVLCVLGLAGPVFGLIEQPRYGFGGSARGGADRRRRRCSWSAFAVWERRTPEPMMPLHLFAVRNFAVGNLTTLGVYGGLGVATFFTVVVRPAGRRLHADRRRAVAAADHAADVHAVSRRFGALADRLGPRLFMAARADRWPAPACSCSRARAPTRATRP